MGTSSGGFTPQKIDEFSIWQDESTAFFALFLKMKVPGLDSFIQTHFLWSFIPAGRPAGWPGQPNLA